jgi:hypothetical protein
MQAAVMKNRCRSGGSGCPISCNLRHNPSSTWFAWLHARTHVLHPMHRRKSIVIAQWVIA